MNERPHAVSLLDRLLHHSIVVVTDGESFRMREAWQRGGGLWLRLVVATHGQLEQRMKGRGVAR